MKIIKGYIDINFFLYSMATTKPNVLANIKKYQQSHREQCREIQRNYIRRRYANDHVFREKMNSYSRNQYALKCAWKELRNIEVF